MSILIIFGTVSGTTEYVATIIQRYLNEIGNQTDLYNVFGSTQPSFTKYDTLLFGAPTYDEGLEPSMMEFISQNTINLSKYKVAVFGLGDKIYPEFCTSVEILEKWIIKSSGKLSVLSLKIDGYPTETESIGRWVKQLINII